MSANILPIFILFLREGLEASLIISILITALKQLNQSKNIRSIWIGVGLAIVVAFGLALLLRSVSDLFGPNFLQVFKTCTYIVAVVIVTWMTFWVQEHSKNLKKELMQQAGTASSGFALGLLAFSTVGREGIETAIFTLAFAFQSGTTILLIGAALGTLVAVGLGILIYRFGYRLNYRIFFRVMGLILIVMAAGLLSNAIQQMQQLGWITFGTYQVWDLSAVSWMSEMGSVIGSLLHILVGYTEQASILQIIGFVIYVAIAGTLFWRKTRAPGTRRPAPAPVISEPATSQSVH